MICRAAKSAVMARGLLWKGQAKIHHDGDELPKQYYPYVLTKEQKKIIYGPMIKPKIKESFHDVLTMPHQDRGIVGDLFNEVMERDVPISGENVCMLIHQFMESGLMTKEMFDKLENHAYRHKGEYQLRSLFGGLRAAIIYRKYKLMEFFWEEYNAHSQRFTVLELLLLAEAINKNK